MIVLPAIDLKNGQCVRLIQGDQNQVNIYNSNPVSVARYFEKIGAKWIHIVDLDGAFNGEPKNFEVIKNIVESINIPVEVGGGIRNAQIAEKYLELGVARVILGTKALEDRELLKELLDKFGSKIVVSLDAKNGRVATKGWTEVRQEKVIDIAQELEDLGVKTLVYTDISRDGMLSEPNFEMLEELNNNLKLNIIASGGVASEQQLDRLEELGLYGAITGKAVYEKTIDLENYLKEHVS